MGGRIFETSEEGHPWIVYQYPRPDWLALILGSLIVCECLICGKKETVKIPRMNVWFPVKDDDYRHPYRDRFLAEHGHPDKCSKEMRVLWAKPLKNI